MPVIDLTRYIVADAGTWTDPSQDQNLFGFTLADTRSPERLMLRWAGDFVALTGPLRVRVTVQAENMTLPLAYVGNLVPDAAATVNPSANPAGAAPNATINLASRLYTNPAASLYQSAVGRAGKGALSLQASTIYTYALDIAAGQAWPFSLSEQLDALRLQNARSSRLDQLGNNLGYRVIIEPAFAAAKLAPVSTSADLPCDFAVANQPDTGRFFPVACEPCEGSVTGLPPSDSVALVIPAADGGCVRTRFFNGMFITREDLETEQRYHRLKSKLHNRASGAGVVWGLNVGKHGDVVCVQPGYGVDCCGNDVVLTSMYQVDIAALLADPAAHLRGRGRAPVHMNLLLEYVECPSDARPVHGDPCAPEASRCEMSRIRESSRLRLVPPCDYDAAKESAPIQHFLDDVRRLRAQFPTGQVPVGTAADRPPFRVRVTVNGNGANAVVARPAAGNSTLTLRATERVNSVTVEMLMDPLFTFVQGSLSGQASAPAGAAPPATGTTRPPGGTTAGTPASPAIVDPSDPIDLSLAKPARNPRVTFTIPATAAGAQLVVRLADWQAQAILANQDDPVPGGNLTLTMAVAGGQFASNSMASTFAVAPPKLAPKPCSDAPCATGSNGRTAANDCGPYNAYKVFESGDSTPVLPWLHTDPTHETSAGDPKVLGLAALGGWLSQMLVRDQAGTANELTSARRELAQGIYRLAWMMLFGVSPKADPAALGGALQRLLEGWCETLLWKGPHCCSDPHGVVIGCAVVEGGTIQRVDPFGGRRYVIHYPLLEHWGAQFGLAPIDISAMRFFSKICCVAGLPAPATGAGAYEVAGEVVEVGGGYLALGDPQAFASKIQDKQIATVRRVSTPEMIVAVLSLIGTKPAASTQGQSYTALVLADFVADQTVTLLVPAV
jgi:hypothetical protein